MGLHLSQCRPSPGKTLVGDQPYNPAARYRQRDRLLLAFLVDFLATIGNALGAGKHGYRFSFLSFLLPKKQKAGTEIISDFDPGRG